MFRLRDLVMSAVETSPLRREIEVRDVGDCWEEFGTLVGQSGRPAPLQERGWRDRVTDDNTVTGTDTATNEVWTDLGVGLQPEYCPPWPLALSQQEAMRSLLARGSPWELEEVRAAQWGVRWQPVDETVMVNSVTAGARYVIDVPPASYNAEDEARLSPVAMDSFVILVACGTVYAHDDTYYCHCCQAPVKLRPYGPTENRLQPALRHIDKLGHKDGQFNEVVHKKSSSWRIYPYFWISHPVFKTGVTARMLMDGMRSSRLHPALWPLAHAMQSELTVDVHSVYIHAGRGSLMVFERSRDKRWPSAVVKGDPPFVFVEATCPSSSLLDGLLGELYRSAKPSPRRDLPLPRTVNAGLAQGSRNVSTPPRTTGGSACSKDGPTSASSPEDTAASGDVWKDTVESFRQVLEEEVSPSAFVFVVPPEVATAVSSLLEDIGAWEQARMFPVEGLLACMSSTTPTVRSVVNDQFLEKENDGLEKRSLEVRSSEDRLVASAAPSRRRPSNDFDWSTDQVLQRAGVPHPGWGDALRPRPDVRFNDVVPRSSARAGRGDVWWLYDDDIKVKDSAELRDLKGFWKGFPSACRALADDAELVINHRLCAGQIPAWDWDVSGKMLLRSPSYLLARRCGRGMRHCERALHQVQRLARVTPLRPDGMVFVARSLRAFLPVMKDELGRDSGLRKPEALVQHIYKYEAVRAREGVQPFPNEEAFPWPEVYSDVRPDEWFYAPETDEARRQQRREQLSGPYSLNSWWRWDPKVELKDVSNWVLDRYKSIGH
ncbi:hypothetical protein FOZ60_014716 [Perkinsus olseni]|uniref:Uncharacterized protein n=1 Tax=Perkinsus olseni TaxID=32597 RepID=A0A7J6P6Q4_PEROL|nr:hypothetical protein FOZ60_014716 [Perkinsus olseni]